MGNKEKKQIAALGVILVVILGIMGYMYRDRLLPAPSAVAPAPAAVIPGAVEADLVAGIDIYRLLIARSDYKSLKQYGDIPVRATVKGTERIFGPENGTNP
ncbi:hypothetical protein AMJ57_02900 [Parcubacteria bacterium SG8_24]|nr:MAG: hypothetical protein AMJ57_02900 [Parcubacteria bacterium SG8_24]